MPNKQAITQKSSNGLWYTTIVGIAANSNTPNASLAIAIPSGCAYALLHGATEHTVRSNDGKFYDDCHVRECPNRGV